MAKKTNIPWEKIRQEYETCKPDGSLWSLSSLARHFGVNRSHLSRTANSDDQPGGKWVQGRYATEIRNKATERALSNSNKDNELHEPEQQTPHNTDNKKIISISNSLKSNIDNKSDQLAHLKSDYLKHTEVLRKLTMLEVAKMVPKQTRQRVLSGELTEQEALELAGKGRADWKNLKNIETAVKIIEKLRTVDWKILAPEENNEIELPESIKRVF